MLTIELSTVAFYREDIAREIALRDCGVPMKRGPRRALAAFYGLQGKQDGFVAARSYAEKHGLKYTVIDFLVELEKQNPGLMKPEDLADYDFLNFSRATKRMSEQLALWLLQSEVARSRGAALQDALSSQSLRTEFAQCPALVDDLVDVPNCQHLKVVAFQAMTEVGDRPISIGNVPYRHWSSIVEATCRLNPTVRISLDPPMSV